MERSNIYVDIGQYPKAIDDPKVLYKRGLAFYRNK